MQDISTSIDGYWAAAGNGDVSFVVASFMTNVAFASLRQVVNDLLEHDENLCYSKFFQICSSFRGSFESELRNQNIIGTEGSLLSRLQHIGRTLAERQTDGNLFWDPSCARCEQKFASQVYSIAINGTAINKTGDCRFISSAVTENVVHWVSHKTIPLNGIMKSTPVYSEVAEDLTTDEKNKKESWSAILGLNLLTQSYGVYLRCVKQPHLVPRNRIAALKIAQQVNHQITALLQDQTCFPCRCSQTLGWHLQSMALDLQCYGEFSSGHRSVQRETCPGTPSCWKTKLLMNF